MIKTKKITEKKMTIEDLAIMVQEGFVGVESRMAKQIDLLSLTERVDNLEKEMKGMDGNFHIMFGELKAIRERLDRIEKNDVTADIISLDLRVKKLEKKVKL